MPAATVADTPRFRWRGYMADVARLPRNFAIAHDYQHLQSYVAATRHGEMVVRAGGCDGTPVGTFPLPDPATAPTRFGVTGTVPPGLTDGDLCMTFTVPVTGPLYAVGQVVLARAR